MKKHSGEAARNRPHANPPGGPLRGPRSEIALGDAAYPGILACIPHPPKRLYVMGDPGALTEGLAVIGARKATPYGLGCAERFARDAASKGIVIISGGAYGCDAQAHRGALSAGGKTVAVLGGGIDVPYPKRHVPLFQQIIDCGGAVISEQEWTMPPLPGHFRARNRIIAGLARATLVVEAGLPSGTFSTADEALNANRDVLVVPGSITSPSSQGANYLIAQGATPIIDAKSFDTACTLLFGTLNSPDQKSMLQETDDELLRALSANPMRLEEMLGLGLEGEGRGFDQMSALTIHLAALEREGRVARYPDGRYGPVVV